MFGLFKSKPKDLPTERQLNYARKLGIVITPRMSKSDVSKAIDAAERKNPKVKRQREQINRNQAEKDQAQWEKGCGPELLAAEEQWLSFADSTRFMLAVYIRGKNRIVDVLEVNDAYIDGKKKKKLKLCVAAPKVVKDQYIGDSLAWEREFELPIENLLFHDPLHADFHPKDNSVYQRLVEKGLKKAKCL